MGEFFSAYWLEMFLICVLVYYAMDGFYRGFFLLVLETVGFVIALAAASLLFRFPAALIQSRFSQPYMFAAAVGFFLIWAAVDLVWPLAVRAAAKRIPDRWKLSLWNHRAGIIPGVLNGALLFSALLTVMLAFPLPEWLKARVSSSPVAAPMLTLAHGVEVAFKPLLGPLAQTDIDLLTIRPQATESLDLHFTVHDGRIDPASEQEMLDLVNGERKSRGLAPLQWSDRLRDVARAHSQDMLERGYFAHVDPDGRDPAERVSQAGIAYGLVGENLALAPTVAIAHRGLMESPGHRANILNDGFKNIGIGIVDAGVYGKMFTQVFSD